MENLSRARLTKLLRVEADGDEEWVSGAKSMVDQWVARGDGVAVYRNEDLGHAEMGRMRFVSFGGPAAQFRDPPPARLPDFPDEINWRYVLFGLYRKEA
jgi:hypothetical protein